MRKYGGQTWIQTQYSPFACYKTDKYKRFVSGFQMKISQNGTPSHADSYTNTYAHNVV